MKTQNRPELKVGDRVRFRSDGEIGELNRSQNLNTEIFHTVKKLCKDGRVYHEGGGAYAQVQFDICNDFSDIQVGDKVERYWKNCKHEITTDTVVSVSENEFNLEICEKLGCGGSISKADGIHGNFRDYWYVLRIVEKAKPKPLLADAKVGDKERPLRNLILRAKEQGMNIRTWYQGLIFTPESLTYHLNNGKYRWWNIGDWELTKREANMPMPEPEFKVGDWVRTEDGDGEFMSYAKGHVYDNSVFFGVNYVTYDAFIRLTTGKYEVYPVSSLIKLATSEVRIKITLEGQVTKPVDNAGARFWLYYSTDEYVSIELDALSHKDRELVESLLKAQEEEKK